MLNELASSLNIIVANTKHNLPYLLQIFSVLWGAYFLNLILGKKLLYLGIIPRHILGIPGIICSPFLHADFNHLFFNTIPIIILSDFILMNGIYYYLNVSI